MCFDAPLSPAPFVRVISSFSERIDQDTWIMPKAKRITVPQSIRVVVRVVKENCGTILTKRKKARILTFDIVGCRDNYCGVVVESALVVVDVVDEGE